MTAYTGKYAGHDCPAPESSGSPVCLACQFEHVQSLAQVEYLLNTGNLVSNGTLDLSQNTGFTVVAEKLNFFR